MTMQKVRAATPTQRAAAALVFALLAVALWATLTRPFGASASAYHAPMVLSVEPDTGPASGGTRVTINGHNLADATMVTFGGVATQFTVANDNQLTAIVPPGHGTVDVIVTEPGGTSRNRHLDDFTYTA